MVGPEATVRRRRRTANQIAKYFLLGI